MCMIDGGETAECYVIRQRRAAKAHICSECSREIAPKESYFVAFMVYEGRTSNYKTCQHCRVVQTWLGKNCGGFIHEGIYEDILEHCAQYPRLRFSLSKFLAGMQFRWGTLRNGPLWRLPKLPPLVEDIYGQA